LALLVIAEGKIPLFHHTYAWNQHDSVTFQGVIDEIASRCQQLSQEACDITLMLDKRNNLEDTLNKY